MKSRAGVYLQVSMRLVLLFRVEVCALRGEPRKMAPTRMMGASLLIVGVGKKEARHGIQNPPVKPLISRYLEEANDLEGDNLERWPRFAP